MKLIVTSAHVCKNQVIYSLNIDTKYKMYNIQTKIVSKKSEKKTINRRKINYSHYREEEISRP